MPIGNIPFLMTATFDVGRTPHVVLSKREERVEKYMEGVIAWLEDPLCQRIVFAKNCSTRVNQEVLEKAATAYGKELEYLEVSASSKTVVQGKGYGEGDLIRQAVGQSLFLREAEDFIKVTGKLYVPHAAQLFTREGEGEFLLNSENRKAGNRWHDDLLASMYQNEAGCSLLGFLRRRLRIPWGLVSAPVKRWIDTRIYRVRRDFYQRVLVNSHRRCHDALGYTLEAVLHDDLRNQRGIRLIRQESVILGTSGTLGTTAGEYSPRIKELARELARKLMAQ